MTLEQAIQLLKNAVKYSTIEGQKHLDFTLVNAHEREKYLKALAIAQMAVTNGEITQDQLKDQLDLL